MVINVLQISEYCLPKYITEYNKKHIDGIYSCYGKQETTWLNYIDNEAHLAVFKKINNYILKMYYFIFYYLYVNGGFYINENVIIDPNIQMLDLTKELIRSVKLFLGVGQGRMLLTIIVLKVQ